MGHFEASHRDARLLRDSFQVVTATPRSDINLSVAMPALSADLTSLNLFLVPDQEAEESKVSSFRSSLSYDDLTGYLKRAVLSAKRRPISTTMGMTERNWLSYANKSWASIKNSSLYQEYSRLM